MFQESYRRWLRKQKYDLIDFKEAFKYSTSHDSMQQGLLVIETVSCPSQLPLSERKYLECLDLKRVKIMARKSEFTTLSLKENKSKVNINV